MRMIYGVAFLAACYLVGQLIGEALGKLLGINTNVGGVGFAMLLLIFIHHWMKENKWFTTEMDSGILFWSNLYIPVIVAMSAIQNVSGALSGGLAALVVGIIPTASCLLLIPLLSRLRGNQTESFDNPNQN